MNSKIECLIEKVDYIDSQIIFDYVSDYKYTIFLDSSMQNEHYGKYSLIVLNPLEIFSAALVPDINKQISEWKSLFANNQVEYPHLPFTGGLVGFFSYDLGKQLEFISDDATRIVEDFYFGLYNQAFIFDLSKHELYIIVVKPRGYDVDHLDQFEILIKIYNICKASTAYKIATPISMPHIDFKPNFTQNQYIDMVKRAIKYIYDGDIFEVNLAQCFASTIPGDYPCAELYRRLRYTNPAPFSVYMNFGSLVVMSASVERFLSVRERTIETRPIKGTCKRSSDIEEDIKLARQLKLSLKDCAENVMIVDLMRNDLSKICKKDSINVTQLCGIESFTNIHHLVSVIEGELKNSSSIFDIIAAAFPGGSITGAPKIRAMEIIEELEPTKRGVYCGSIGYFSFNGDVDLSIAIRTIIKNNNDIRFYAGGAITLDSDPIKEYEETLLKAHKLNEIFK